MFNQGHDSYEGGSVTNPLTGKVYTYARTPDDSDKRQAIAECEKEWNSVVAAMQKRAGRTLTLREILAGKPNVKDTRPIGQQVREDAKPIRPAEPDPDRNPYRARIEELEAQPVYVPADRAAKNRRLKMMKEAAAKWDAKRQAEKDLEAKTAAAKSDLVDAKASLCLIRMNEEFTEADVAAATERLVNLEKTLDTAAYKSARDAWETEVKQRRSQKADALLASPETCPCLSLETIEKRPIDGSLRRC